MAIVHPGRDTILLPLDFAQDLREMIDDYEAWRNLDEENLDDYRDFCAVIDHELKLRSPYGAYKG
tara:strand:- start:1257 stop:1451 length:195 start_codon:yes stop_codon:yes gene_type:complete